MHARYKDQVQFLAMQDVPAILVGMQAGGVDVVAGDSSIRPATELDGTVDSPIGVRRVVDRDEDLAIHRHLPN